MIYYCILYDGKSWKKNNHDRLSGLAAAAAAAVIHICRRYLNVIERKKGWMK
jgi:hypothetical protein